MTPGRVYEYIKKHKIIVQYHNNNKNTLLNIYKVQPKW